MPIRAYLDAARAGRAFSIFYVTSTSQRADEVSSRVRAAIERIYQETGDKAFAPGPIWTRTEWETAGGLRWTAAGWSGATGGIGANLLVLDDVIGTSQVYRSGSTRHQIRRVIQEDLLSRLVNGGAALQMETRRGIEDTTAWLLREWPDVWEEHVWRCLTSRGYLWPAMYGAAWRATMPHLTDSSPVWRALYQQEPIPEGGTLIPIAWTLPTYPETPEGARKHADQVVIGCDLTNTAKKTSDHAAFVVIACRGAYRDVLHVVRRQCGYVEQRQILRDLCRTWKPNAVIVERAAGGDAMVDELAGEIAGLRGERPIGDKVTRLSPHLPRFAALQVRTPAGGEPWVGSWREEVSAFTGIDGEADDQLDATVWALEGAEDRRMPVISFRGARGAPGHVGR
jgi:predicted phage terminase large subunit-like protein